MDIKHDPTFCEEAHYEAKILCNFCGQKWIEGFYDGGNDQWDAKYNSELRCPNCGEFNTTDDMVA